MEKNLTISHIGSVSHGSYYSSDSCRQRTGLTHRLPSRHPDRSFDRNSRHTSDRNSDRGSGLSDCSLLQEKHTISRFITGIIMKVF